MDKQAIVLERLFPASKFDVWKALTNKDEMKQWYFDLEEFKAEIGFKFSFTGGPSPNKQYVHVCEVLEVVPENKLTYSWRYEGYSGISFVTFELFEKETNTLLRLTHKGVESFPNENTDFNIKNFEDGWNDIINNSLNKYLKKADS